MCPFFSFLLNFTIVVFVLNHMNVISVASHLYASKIASERINTCCIDSFLPEQSRQCLFEPKFQKHGGPNRQSNLAGVVFFWTRTCWPTVPLTWNLQDVSNMAITLDSLWQCLLRFNWLNMLDNCLIKGYPFAFCEWFSGFVAHTLIKKN